MISEYNIRQLSLMFEKINHYKAGQIRLNKLINDLEALLSCLVDIDEDWNLAKMTKIFKK